MFLHPLNVRTAVIATTWSAYLSYAKLLTGMGKASEAGAYEAKAEKVRNSYVHDWWNPPGSNYFAGRTIGVSGWITNFDQYSKETYDFQAVKCLAEPGMRAKAMLDKIHENYLANRTNYNFESFTYLPEAFYNYGMNEPAWFWLKCIMDSHYEYPEISFTAIGFIATGMMGIEPDAPNHKISTLGRLTPEVGWVQLDHIPVGTYEVLVKHESSNRTTSVRNNTDRASLTWEARFPGSYEALLVDGVPHKAKRKTRNGLEVTYVQVVLGGGQQKTVTAAATSK